MAGASQERFPQFRIPDGENIPAELKIDSSKAQRELGLRLSTVRETVIDGAVTLIQLGASSYFMRGGLVRVLNKTLPSPVACPLVSGLLMCPVSRFKLWTMWLGGGLNCKTVVY